MIKMIKKITVLFAIVGLLGLFAYSGKAFAVSDGVDGEGTVDPYITIDTPSNFSTTGQSAAAVQTVTANIVWTIDTNDRFTISSIAGDGVTGATNGTAVPELERMHRKVDDSLFNTLALAASGDYDVLTTTWGIVVAANEASGNLTWAGGDTPTGTPANLISAISGGPSTDMGNFIDYDGQSTITLYCKGVSAASDSASGSTKYECDVTITVSNII